MKLWRRWRERCEREEDARPQALVRLILPLLMALDLLNVWRLGLVGVFFRGYADGGINPIENEWTFVDRLLPGEIAGPVAWGLTVLALLAASAGVAVRPALIAAVVLWAQIGHIAGPSDRGVDRLVRTALLVLIFSQAHRRLALGGRPHLAQIPAWPADLLRYLLVLVYLASGVSKLMVAPDWLGWSAQPPLYRVLADPMSGHMDPIALVDWIWALQILGWSTIALELSAPLILTRWAPWWALGGIGMHLGIAATMDLGVFPWAMLALYPLLFAPWIERSRGATGTSGG